LTGIKTASAKAKGRKLQVAVKDKILETYPELEEEDVKSTTMGEKGEDVQLSPAARRLFPYSVECKARASFPAYAWYMQAKHNSKGYEPLLIVKQDRSKPLVLVDMEHFFSLLERLK